MKVLETPLSGLLIFEPARHRDDRGFFAETWNRERLVAAGLAREFVQDNQSMSVETGTLRGLHYQAPPRAQCKLVRCGRGRLFDVAVDVRNGSPTFGQWTGAELSFENGRQMFVPAGFLHGFITREPMTEILYKVTDHYSPECDGAVRWDSCGVDWGLEGDPKLSAKDAGAQTLAEFDSPFEWTGQ